MINNTLDFTINNSKSIYRKYTINRYEPFIQWFPKTHTKGEQSILDLGCGSGRDSLEFIKRG